jgi:xylulokinase
MSFYLGLDTSTQSLTAILIEASDTRRAVVGTRSVVYDTAFPSYPTRNGVVPSADPLVAQSFPLMWVEALDRVMAEIGRQYPAEVARLAAVSGSAQQHGSVYLRAGLDAVLGSIGPAESLAGAVAPLLARLVAPIWMDASTTEECRSIAAAVGGDRALAQLTGSRAFERFTGPQIRKFATQEPAAYASTARIDLVSSFMASLMAGRAAPLDPGDASGMNLMRIADATWSGEALDATAPDLRRRLPPIVPAWTTVGPLAEYWRRYGYGPAKAVVWSGDNPCSLIGTGLVREGRVAVSLGTSDTIFGLMSAPRIDPDGAGHVFGAPTGAWMGLTCFRNGSLARERVRDTYGMDWTQFSAALAATPPGNGGAMMLPWFEPEITPTVSRPGVRRQDLDPANGPANVRAVVEAQMMAIANHSSWMGVSVDVVHATGGAAVNRAILQVLADVMNAEVREFDVTNSAALGAALRAYHADRLASTGSADWAEVIAGFAEPKGVAARPTPANASTYQALRRRYAAFEQENWRPGG